MERYTLTPIPTLLFCLAIAQAEDLAALESNQRIDCAIDHGPNTPSGEALDCDSDHDGCSRKL